MTRYWLTTHWPELVVDPHEIRYVYIQDRFYNDVKTMNAGDRILVYEFESGPPEKMVENGKTVLRSRHKGRQAIVWDSRVTESLRPRKDYSPQTFGERDIKNFNWMATTDDHRPMDVPRPRVNEVLEYSPKNSFRGFNGGRGIKEISFAQYTELTKAAQIPSAPLSK